MAITGRTPEECIEKFGEHFQLLVGLTISEHHTPHVIFLPESGNPSVKALIALRDGDVLDSSIPVQVGDMELHLFISQLLEARRWRSRYRLATTYYSYRICRDRDQQDTLVRWARDENASSDYVEVNLAAFCPGSSGAGQEMFRIPTGRVLIEDVIRFLIDQFRFQPACGLEKCQEILSKGETQLRERFTHVEP